VDGRPKARGGRRPVAIFVTAVVLPVLAWLLAARSGPELPGPGPAAREPAAPPSSRERVRVDERHVFQGVINRSGRAVGFHSRPGGHDPATARVTRILDAPNEVGVYRARVDVLDPSTRAWVPKNAPSTFFPDAWPRERVLEEISGAFRAKSRVRDGYWEGRSPSGLRIGGYVDRDGDVATAFPIY
jgi:hypothetical protein